jgi:hypothetical protein
MKRVLLGAAVAAITGLCICAAAMAADSTAYLAQCKANIANDPPPPPGAPAMNSQTRLAFCQCIADSGDQAVLDEGLSMAKLPPQERFAKFGSASDKYKEVVQACASKLNVPAPPSPPPATQ